MRIYEFRVLGMNCASCAAAAQRAVKRVHGVECCGVTLANERLRVRGDGVSCVSVIEALKKCGLTAEALEDRAALVKLQKLTQVREMRSRRFQLSVALVFALLLFYTGTGRFLGLPAPVSAEAFPLWYALIQIVMLFPVLAVSRGIFVCGFRDAVSMQPSTDTLIALGTSAAILYSLVSFFRILRGDTAAVSEMYWDTAGLILAFVLLGQSFERRAAARTQDSIEALRALAPDHANILQPGGTLRRIPIADIMAGDQLYVHPGERLPADGRLESPLASVDESLLTGESIPVEKQAGDMLIGGSVNGSGAFTMTALRVGDETSLSQMIRLVRDAQQHKTPASHITDRVCAVLVPAVLGIALLSAVIWLFAGKPIAFALNAFISVLVVACPCAVGLAVPFAAMAGIARAARHGILVKHGGIFEAMPKLDCLMLDKTGTVTNGKPAVTDVLPYNIGEETFLAMFASGAQCSGHPIAKAITAHAAKRGMRLLPCDTFSAFSGFDASAAVEGHQLLMGSEKLFEERGIPCPMNFAALQRCGKLPVLLAIDGKFSGVIGIADTLKPDAKSGVAKLQRCGIHPILVTGDDAKTAHAVAGACGIKEVYAEMSPEAKAERLRSLQQDGLRTGMAGDGINDAIALGTADIGFAMGTGMDAALASADVVLLRGRIESIAETLSISRAVMRILRQNLIWAFFYHGIAIPLAAGALTLFGGPLLSPPFAALLMCLSSVTVLLNALRLKRMPIRF